MSSSHQSSADNVPVRTVWERLKADPAAVLIDVRTQAEWAYVGIPDLSSLARRPLLVEWLTFPGNEPNVSFVAQLSRELASIGATTDTDLYFICRSGARSLSAANAMTAAGYRRCHNVAEGFEGPLDSERHRGRQSGWKAENLPWVQG